MMKVVMMIFYMGQLRTMLTFPPDFTKLHHCPDILAGREEEMLKEEEIQRKRN